MAGRIRLTIDERARSAPAPAGSEAAPRPVARPAGRVRLAATAFTRRPQWMPTLIGAASRGAPAAGRVRTVIKGVVMLGAVPLGTSPLATADGSAPASYGEAMIRAATEGGYVDPATWDRYEARLTVPLRFRRSLLGDDGIGGRAALGLGDVELDSVDDYFGTIHQQLAVDGGQVLLEEEQADGSWRTIFDGTARDVLPDGERARVRLRDWWALLERPLQEQVFGGSGGWDGGADVAGKPLPICYGAPRNITPVRIGDSPPRYRYGDGGCGGLDAVYEGGTTWIAGVDYSDYPAVGGFTLAREPRGDITCDVRGTKVAGVPVETTGAVIRDIVGRRFGLSARILGAAFDQFETDVPGRIDWYVSTTERPSAADAITALIKGAAAWCGFDSLGRFEVGQWKVPVGPAVMEIGEGDLEPGSAATPRDLPKAVFPPPATARGTYERNWTVQGPGDLLGDSAGGADPIGGARRNWLSEAYRWVTSTDPATALIHRSNREAAVREGFFRSQLDAQLALQAWHSLWIGTRGLYDLKTRIAPGQLRLGDVVLLKLRRHGLMNRYARIAETYDDWGARKTELVVMT